MSAPARAGRLAWASCALLAFGFAAPALSLLPARLAEAQPDEAEQLRTRLVEGEPSTWPGLLAPLEKSSAQVGAVLGPLLRDRSPKAAPHVSFMLHSTEMSLKIHIDAMVQVSLSFIVLVSLGWARA